MSQTSFKSILVRTFSGLRNLRNRIVAIEEGGKEESCECLTADFAIDEEIYCASTYVL